MNKLAPLGLIAALAALAGVAHDAFRPSAAVAQGGPKQPKPDPGFGVNLSYTAGWSFERSFANLATGNNWFLSLPGKGWTELDLARVAADGSIKQVAAGETMILPLTYPASGPPVRVRCTYEGSGDLQPNDVTDVSRGRNSFEFTVRPQHPEPKTGWLSLSRQSADDPVRAIDCREADMARDALFADEFLQSVKPYKVIRFLDWQRTNNNERVTWAGRAKPSSFLLGAADGVPVEHMVALVRQTGASPWFLMPWNADEAYYRGFAQYVHDTLPADRKVYLELGNEVWNYGFKVTHQAIAEGEAAKLEKGWGAGLMQYAKRSIDMFRIWEKVFADRPGQLVRVVSAQNDNTISAKIITDYPGVAQHADALATAPYFGGSLFEKVQPGASLDTVFPILAADLKRSMGFAVENKGIAAAKGLRYITYEAGQHVVTPDVEYNRSLQRDPRMGALYRTYLSEWENQIGDLMVLFSSTFPVAHTGAFGLREYAGQPLQETPKRRAVLDAIEGS